MALARIEVRIVGRVQGVFYRASARDEALRLGLSGIARNLDDGAVDLLVARMISGARELVAGLHTDPQFGRCVMVGVGGVLTEALGDVVFRLAPLDATDADEMLDELRTQELLGPLRGEPAVDRAALVDVLLALSRLADAEPTVLSVDLNPLVLDNGAPIAVDALVEMT
jgi:acetyl-CoA synthetase (ADP-forming)